MYVSPKVHSRWAPPIFESIFIFIHFSKKNLCVAKPRPLPWRNCSPCDLNFPPLDTRHLKKTKTPGYSAPHRHRLPISPIAIIKIESGIKLNYKEQMSPCVQRVIKQLHVYQYLEEQDISQQTIVHSVIMFDNLSTSIFQDYFFINHKFWFG